MAILTERTKVPGDLILHIESLEYCTKTAIVRNPTASAVVMNDIVGYPVVAGTNGADYNLAVQGNEASVVGLLLDGEPGGESIAAGANGTSKYQVLVHPPAVLNQNKLPVNDFNGVAFTNATLLTRLRALLFELRSEPTKYTTL